LKFENLVKNELVIKKNSDILKALKIGAVDTLLVSANYYHSSITSQKIIKLIELAENTSSKVEFVTNPKLVKGLAKYDHVLALLRYKFK
jgi:stalled ribosome rescue protein Dom34